MTNSVSIPHRYSTNKGKNKTKIKYFVVSIPHRYSTNFHCSMGFFYVFRVSIPHRYSTNEVEDKNTDDVEEFQSLIGILQTIAGY